MAKKGRVERIRGPSVLGMPRGKTMRSDQISWSVFISRGDEMYLKLMSFLEATSYNVFVLCTDAM